MSHPPQYPGECELPWVDTASFVQEDGSLIATIDGEEVILPGGSVNVQLEDGKAKVHVYAVFKAGAVDVVAEHTGS